MQRRNDTCLVHLVDIFVRTCKSIVNGAENRHFQRLRHLPNIASYYISTYYTD